MRLRGTKKGGTRTQRKNVFGAICHLVKTVMTPTENICSVRCEETGDLCVGKMCLTTNRDGNYSQVAKYLHKISTLKWK